MKRLLLIALIYTAPAFAQDETEKEERQVEIRMESLGGGVEVGAASGSAVVSIASFPDKSVWHFYGSGNKTYCWVDEDNEPHCKEVKSE
ncbi:hypothetical protein N9R29_00195 [Gammaproteobacteria bacterium]|jgi:hypothetical protein|nr:hypothetical protein [Gammaproteobacteria bacterium]MDB2483046.1 hypothetical protein [Gammaproteobacteria bacterium]MDB9981643.1 hypothetical protein [Gammaproteobacteria bacterium]